MNWSKVYSIAKGIAGLSGLLAFITFAYSYYEDVQIRQSEADQSWQEAEIYRVVVSAGLEGISFEEILSQVQSAYFVSGADASVGHGVGKESSVRRALIGLTAKNAVSLSNDDTYSATIQPKAFLQQDFIFAVREACAEKMFSLINEKPGVYSSNDLVELCKADGLGAFEIHKVLYGFIYSNPPVFVPAGDDPSTPQPEVRYSPDAKLRVLY